MIYTSYFANMRKINKNHPELTNFVSIARYAPKWYTGKEYKYLAPHLSLLMDYKNGRVNDEYYTRLFNIELNELDPHYVVKKLRDNPILLCYEKPSDFCHRFLVAKWFIKSGYEVKELENH
jgi:hypothetical protein